MSPINSQLSVLITGDLTLDWHIVNKDPDGGTGLGWNTQLWTRACSQMGGAGLLANLVEKITSSDANLSAINVIKPDFPTGNLHPCQGKFHNSYALWSQFKGINQPVWRVEKFLGLDPSQNDTALPSISEEAGLVNILVLDDANLGFRDHPELWPDALSNEAQPDWVILKMARPVAKGPLWENLRDRFADRLIVIIPVNDLRRSEVHISQGLSWERTAQDIYWELVHNPAINSLAACSDVIISFDTAGAVHLSRNVNGKQSDTPQGFLFFDPDIIERGWKKQHPGYMIGYTTCLTASIAYQVIKSPANPDLSQGIQSGLAALRLLHQEGYSFSEDKKDQLSFPYQKISAKILQDEQPFAAVDIQNPVFFYNQSEQEMAEDKRSGWWTILEDQHQENLHEVAEQIVLYGIGEALDNIPLGKFGHLTSVDRQEIESFRSINNLASEYLGKESQKRPLSIAVFGAPGSGKSFGITQVAETLAPDRLKVLEFNLSQFSGPEEIIDALHLVRDVVLSGGIPLVFWDEFDTPLNNKSLGWLRYFLSPMQDGSFRQGQMVHPIGRAIFVFAGGTSHKIEDFGKDLDPEAYRAAKVPDFVSRLKGFVNILGPNPPEDKDTDEKASDPYYIIRRAILLRSLLERGAKHLFTRQDGKKVLKIDRGVLQAFLGNRKYKHGIRSMESIITMSALSGKRAYERSCLPPKDQLNLHVDAVEFLSLVQQIKLEGELLEKLARANHRVYQRRMKVEISDSAQDSAAKTWEALPEDEKAQNRDAVRDIPNKLAFIGFVMMPSRSNQPIFKFPKQANDLNKLARMEHARWVRAKEDAGWSYAATTDKSKKVHSSMVPWEELTEKDQKTDIEFVRAIPEILAEAGYTMVKIHDEPKTE